MRQSQKSSARLPLATLLTCVLVIGGCSQGSSDTESQAPAPTTTESTLINEANEVINEPGSAQEKQQEVCAQMEEQGSFDGTGVTPEEVGC